MTVNNLPNLAITMGDPAGIGGEVILKALIDPQITTNCNITVIGTRKLLEEIYYDLKQQDDNLLLANPDNINILEVEERGKIILGEESEITGLMSFEYMERAIAETLKGKFAGIITGPIAKSAWKKAGFNYPGQTELLAEKAGVKKFGMLFVGRSPHTNWTLRTLLATTHIPLNEISTTLTPALLTEKLDLLEKCLKEDFGIKNGKIAIAGLNPHSGEKGQLGKEEKDWINDWLENERKQRENLQIDGLIPPDTMWVKPGQAWYDQKSIKNGHDGYLAMYHDQGLIPVKLIAFDRAVNTTIGLPFIRSSPDHGTAFDIAGKGIASESSMKSAIEFAIELAQLRL
ncbi:MAG TPA: 4-hydroxythreonine-4-phosphate dehydrogenase PdxA [Allocoleopsis sp.]